MYAASPCLKIIRRSDDVSSRQVPCGVSYQRHLAGCVSVGSPQSTYRRHICKTISFKNTLEVEVTVQNKTAKKTDIQLQGNIREWINCAGTDINSAPVPTWSLGMEALYVTPHKVSIDANASQKVTLQIPVNENTLKYWTPESPNLYALLLSIQDKKKDY